jgi:hypothetical protein
VCPAYHSDFEIKGDRLEMGIGPARTIAPLVSLGSNRLLMEGKDGPWTKRSSLVFDNGRAGLFLNRSRVIQFEREA